MIAAQEAFIALEPSEKVKSALDTMSELAMMIFMKMEIKSSIRGMIIKYGEDLVLLLDKIERDCLEATN